MPWAYSLVEWAFRFCRRMPGGSVIRIMGACDRGTPSLARSNHKRRLFQFVGSLGEAIGNKSREAVNASFERQESVLQILINNNVAAGPVSRILSAGLLLLDGHSSGPRIAARL